MESIVFWGFNLYAWITIATVLTMFTVLLFTKLRADLVFLGAISILFVLACSVPRRLSRASAPRR